MDTDFRGVLWTIVLCLILGLCPLGTEAKGRFSVSTDLLGYANLATFNADFSYAFARHWGVTVGARYNPFSFRTDDPDKQFQSRQQSYSVGVRYWPWHIWSGWWFSSKVRWQEYNTGGILSPETSEGDRVGAGLYAGYALMVSPHFNVEFGVGVWAGYDKYKRYSCPTCGLTIDQGEKGFILPDDIMISLVYVF